MNAWIIFDDCPSEFGDKQIIKVFGSRRLAEYFNANAKVKKPYECQYYTIQKHKINMETVIGK